MRPAVVVAGVASFYLSLGVTDFPLRYCPTVKPRWLAGGVSGAATHIARTATTMGARTSLCTVVGTDLMGGGIRAELDRLGLLGPGVITGARSSMGVVMVGPDGRRMGYPYLEPVNDVAYPFDVLAAEARGADLLVLTNAKFVRPLVARAGVLGVPIAVDVHLIADVADHYNGPWLRVAHVLFCSDERLPMPPQRWIAEIFERYPRCRIVGVGLGARGAMLGLRDGRLITVRAVAPRGVVSTAGAGDALFATFLYAWVSTKDPLLALQAAVLNAGWKIGHRFPAEVSLTMPQLRELLAVKPPPTMIGHW